MGASEFIGWLVIACTVAAAAFFVGQLIFHQPTADDIRAHSIGILARDLPGYDASYVECGRTCAAMGIDNYFRIGIAGAFSPVYECYCYGNQTVIKAW